MLTAGGDNHSREMLNRVVRNGTVTLHWLDNLPVGVKVIDGEVPPPGGGGGGSS